MSAIAENFDSHSKFPRSGVDGLEDSGPSNHLGSQIAIQMGLISENTRPRVARQPELCMLSEVKC